MKRVYSSGNKKRKAAEEKKQKQDELLAKVPKITSLFGSKNKTATAVDSSSEAAPSTESSTSGIGHTLSSSSGESECAEPTDTDREHDEMQVEDGTETIQDEPMTPSTDAALWKESDNHYLQSYWAKHGERPVIPLK